MSHLALQVGYSNWVYKTQTHSIQRWHHFGTKTSWSPFLWEKRLHPFLYWIKYSWAQLTHILYFINLSVRWNTLLRNQISLCQHIFYYITTVIYNCKKMYRIDNRFPGMMASSITDQYPQWLLKKDHFFDGLKRY